MCNVLPDFSETDRLIDLLPVPVDADLRAQLRHNAPLLGVLELLDGLTRRLVELERRAEAAERQINLLWQQVRLLQTGGQQR